MRCAAAALLLTTATAATAQYPLTAAIEVRTGPHHPAITCLAQDEHGFIWTGSDRGLHRTDGEMAETILRTEGDAVLALHHAYGAAWAALASGVLVRCDALGCDTVLADTLLRTAQVRALVVGAQGTIWLGTYGQGVWRVEPGAGPVVLTGGADGHVNGLAMLPQGRVVAATDQGLVVYEGDRAVMALGENEGAPDNLVLSVTVDEQGRVWAGTDQRGVFCWQPGGGAPMRMHPAWDAGAVLHLAVERDLVWAGTRERGVVVLDTTLTGMGLLNAAQVRHTAVRDMIMGSDGRPWWCDGTATLRHADPDVLVVPGHEDLDLRQVSALCTDERQQLWLATPQGVFRYPPTFFRKEDAFRRMLQVPTHTPVTALAADARGTVWVATFGNGVHAVEADGRSVHYGTANGLCNENVLAVRVAGDHVWCATLDGLCTYEQQTRRWRAVPVPGPGFVYDVLPLDDGRVIAATDGNGLLVVHPDGTVAPVDSLGPRTFYTLLRTQDGDVWAAGPGTGLCHLRPDGVDCTGQERTPFNDGAVVAIAEEQGRVLVFGSTGTVAHDPATRQWTDLTNTLQLHGMQASLNAVAKLPDGTIWIGCDRGLLRLRPSATRYRATVRAVITGLAIGGRPVPVAGGFTTTHDRSDLTVRFSAPHYNAPDEVRFAYQLMGHDAAPLITRDREVNYAGLPPGRYTFQVHALTGDGTVPPPDGAAMFTLEVGAPWWERPGGIVLMALLVVTVVAVVVRVRERRLRQRERLEQEKVRFQLEALRSQVDPHFLFNSFNTLTALIETAPDRAVEHVDRLSTFFRSILQVRDKDLIPLREELELLDGYFALEQARFGDVIALNVHVPPTALDRGIVPLTLQMLVENALKHNAVSAHTPLVVHIHVEGEELVVSNTRAPRMGPPRSTAFGLDSIRRRYAALDPRPVQVVQDDGAFTVRIPLIMQQWP